MFTKSTTRKCLQSQFEMLTNNLSTDSHILFCIIVQIHIANTKIQSKYKTQNQYKNFTTQIQNMKQNMK